MFLKRKKLFNQLKDPQMSEQFMRRFAKFLIIGPFNFLAGVRRREIGG